jgi:hypothetical protein
MSAKSEIDVKHRGTYAVKAVLLFCLLSLFGKQVLALPSARGFLSIRFPAAATTIVTGINNHGRMVGRHDEHGFLAYGRTFVTFDPPGSIQTRPAAINDTDEIVGSYLKNDGSEHGFILVRGVFTTVDFPGSLATNLTGINNSQDIVGIIETPNVHSFLFRSGVFTQVDVPIPNTEGTFAFGINNNGQITGIFYDIGGARAHGFVLNGLAVESFDFPGALNTNVTGINDAGEIVGAADGKAFLRRGTQFDVISVPNSFITKVYGINAAEQMVGAYSDGVLALGFLSNACGRPTIPVPSSQSFNASAWGATATVSQRSGLELSDVKLGSRYMAAKMGLSYFTLVTSTFPLTRCELQPNNGSAACGSRLIDFKTPPASPSDGQTAYVEATYEVDNVGSDPDSCLLITQQYEFDTPVYPALDSSVQGCEPSDTLPCTPFKPIVNYEFIPGPSGETLSAINTAQRLNFQVDGPRPNYFAVFRDCDAILVCPGLPFDAKINPVPTEFYANAILKGGAGTWDNIHQSFSAPIEEPVILNTNPISLGGPGCPRCVHIHWRWGALFSDPTFGNGVPLVPMGSNQDVYFALVHSDPNEENPDNFIDLVDGESLLGSDLALWYSATGYQESDSFFVHGGFFSPSSVGPASVSASITHSKSGTTLTIHLKLSNPGPGTAHGVSINQVLAKVLAGAGAVTYAGPTLPSTNGDLGPGEFLTADLLFNVPSTVKKISLSEGISFQDDFGKIEGTSFSQVVFP